MATKQSEPGLDMSIFYKASGCPLGKLQLENPAHQALLEEALATPSISHSAIREVLLEKWGVGISKDTIGNHRSRPQKCSCRVIPK